ncbi:tetratricopeptide repeat protein [Limobrevibacterium gyesilva]|nr:tetratricopeptide repeat protein [Limobrevibacterium gyesilva]
MNDRELITAGVEARRNGNRPAALEHFLAAIQAAPTEIVARLEAAQELRFAGQLAEALAVLPEDAVGKPQRASLLTLRAILTREQGDRAAALVLFRAVVEACPDHLAGRLEAAQELRFAGQLAEALAILPEDAVGKPQRAFLLTLRAILTRERGDRAAALVLFRAAVEACPDHLGGRLEAAQELRFAGQLAEALAILPEDAVGKPQRASLLTLRAILTRERGDRAAALVLFRAAVEACPDHLAGRLEAAQELRFAGQLAEALAILPEDAVGKPQRAFLLTVRGYLYRRLGDRVASQAAFSAAAAAAAAVPQNPIYHRAVLAEHRAHGCPEQALEWIERLPESLRTTSLLLAERGHIAMAMGEHTAALEAFRAVSALPGAPADCWANLAHCYQCLGAPDQAITVCEEALQREPGHAGTLLRLAELYLLANRYDECRALCSRIRASTDHAAAAWILRCRATTQAEGTAAALALTLRAEAELGPNAALLAYRLELLMRYGRFAEALAVCEAMADRLVDEPQLRLMAARLHLSQHRLVAAAALLDGWEPAAAWQRMHAELLRGTLAESQWRLADAVGHFRAAQALDPGAAAPSEQLGRVALLLLDIETANAALRHHAGAESSRRRLLGQSGNASQSLLGQVMDEYRLDAELIGKLRKVQALPPGARLGQLLSLVRGNPDSTPVAIALLLALRQAGMLDLAVPTSMAQRRIPRRIIQFWAQGAPPPEIAALMQTWRRWHPGHDWRSFDDPSAMAWLEQHGMHDVLRAYRRAREPAQRSDLFRLAFLAKEGGLYADADDACLAPLDHLVPPNTGLLCYQEEFASLGNNLIGAAPGHPVIRRALALATESVLRGDTDLVWLATGPGLLTRAFAQEMAASEHPARAWLADVAVLERGVATNATAMHLQVSYKGSNAHWLRGAFVTRGRHKPGAPLAERRSA